MTAKVRTTSQALIPGKAIGEGRYRLLAQFGVDTRGNAHFWRARDGQLRRDVALTVIAGNASDHPATLAARRTLERAAHAARFSHPSVSRVLDVLSVGAGIDPREGVLGIVVADWSQGTDVIDLVVQGPLSAGAAARLLESLATAVESAQHAGLVLGIDHPQRLRVSPEGVLKLAFPGPLPNATLRDDVRGLGATLYLLLTGRWALPGGPEGLPAAPTGPDGSVLSPNALRPHLPPELASVAVHSLEDTSIGGIRTSAALLRVLDGIADLEEEAELRLVGEKTEHAADDGTVWTTRRPVRDDARRRKLAIAVIVLIVSTIGIIAWLGLQLISFFSDSSGTPAGPPIVVTQPSQQPSPAPPPSSAPPPAPGAPIEPAHVQVYAVKGDKDNATRVNRVIDGNPTTAWTTSNYKQPFPALKPGIGIMAAFDEPERLATVTVDSPSAGTVVEVRTADSPDAKLEDTTLVGTATLSSGQTDITLSAADPAQYVLVWITKLGGGGQNNESEITELAFVRAE